MKRWPVFKLGELVLPTEQRDPREKADEEFCYVDISGVDNETKAIVSTKQLLGSDAPSRARKVIRTGDVIVSTVRPNLNAVAIVPDALQNQICSTGFSVLRPSERVTSRYLFAVARSPFFIDQLVAKTTGANYPAVNDGEVKDVKIPVPPLAEQERIVKLLDEADALRKLRVQADRRTAALLPALFDELFGESTQITIKRFGELLSEPLRNGVSPSKDGKFTANVFTLSAITGTSFDANAFKEAPFARAADEHCYASENLFLICRGNGNRDLVGSGKFPVRIGERIIFPDTMIAAEPDLTVLSPAFLEAAWSSPFVRKQIHAVARTTNGTYKVNQTGLEDIQIPVPPLLLQQTFARRVAEIRELEAAQAAARRRLDALFASLLHRAFAGEL